MSGRYSTRIHRAICSVGILACLALTLGACSLGGGGGSNNATGPIKIGISLSTSGDFSADGEAFQQGYQMWANDVNAHGGLLGRQVKLVLLNDNSDPQQVTTNYQTLITQDKVDLLFGPFSTLLTKPASATADRFGFALVEGAGGGPSVFTRGLKNVFDVSLPVANNLVTFANYISGLPAGQRPTTAAYATEDDPFTQPQVDTARAVLEAAGIKTVYYKVYPAETTDFTSIAAGLVASHPQVVVTGTLLPDVSAFIQAFHQQHFNPQAFVATAGPDQGTQFLQAIGGASVAEGILVPNGWWPDLNAPGNSQLVQEYLQHYGGDKSGISSDVAEAYSVGQVVAQAVTKNNSLDQTRLIATLHSDTFTSVQGPVKFDATGQNTLAVGYLFQWQNGQYIPVYPANVATNPIEFPKPNWP